jgi:nicotinamidase-related amidase
MALSIDPARTAILPMDLQNDIVAGTPNVEPILANIAQVLQVGRQKQVPIVYVTVSFHEDYRDAPLNSPLYQMVKEHNMVRAGTPGAQIHTSVSPQPNELVINKTCVNPFVTTNLQQVLNGLDVNTLILMGLWTNYVVEATARDASDLDYRVIVVSDGCASNSEENHNFAINQILPTLTTVASLDEVLQALQ